MTARRLAATSVLVASAVAFGVTVSSGSPSAPIVSWIAVAVLAAGILAGTPILVVIGVGGSIVSIVAAGATDSDSGLLVLVAAPLLWCSYECAWRSIELRPHVAPDRAAALNWLAVTLGVMSGSAIVGIGLLTASRVAPDGGVGFSVAGVAMVVASSGVLGVMSVRRRRSVAADLARSEGSGAQGARTTLQPDR